MLFELVVRCLLQPWLDKIYFQAECNCRCYLLL
jgi:hypothetical protein